MASSNASTADPAGLRSYFGGPSEASADRTVFRDIFNVLAIVLIVNPSARCSLRISAQSSTDNNSLLLSARKAETQTKGVKIRASTRGQFSDDADNWSLPGGRNRPRLSIDEREQIMIGTAQGESIRSMARRLGRAPSTVMREIAHNGVMRGYVGRYRGRYRFGARRAGVDAKSGYSARIAQLRSEQRARRPKTGKLGRCPALRTEGQAWLVKKYSP